uniref:Protein TAPETUM DETERMINANT 1-like n=1 Tax=Cucumis melo TaxID=3656 RepID=A0A9I9D880_CUCME
MAMAAGVIATSSFFRASLLLFFHLLLLSSFISTEGGTLEKKCEGNSIAISQGQESRMFNGIPTYRVQITNQCLDKCTIYDLHLKCGSFVSSNLINPQIFKRLTVDDCLVNNGSPIVYGETISFQYATTFMFPLSVSSFKC